MGILTKLESRWLLKMHADLMLAQLTSTGTGCEVLTEFVG